VLTEEVKGILSASKEVGWVLEPEAKRLFALAGLDIPRFVRTSGVEEAVRFAEEIGYPLVAKVVSPKVLHKSEWNGVETGVENEKRLREAFDRLSRIDGASGVLVEEMVSGVEVIVGAKIDFQFGPVVLFGIGGVWVEIYRDVVLRMAPLHEWDTEWMFRCLKGRRLLEGYRGSEPIDVRRLKRFLLVFSGVLMDLQDLIESIDLNPVICSSERCIVADARIILRK